MSRINANPAGDRNGVVLDGSSTSLAVVPCAMPRPSAEANGRGRLSPTSVPRRGAQLEAVGRERALIYKTLVLTGLRKGELASLTVAQMKLDAPVPYVELDAEDEKNREGNRVVVRPDLAANLRAWLAEKLAPLQADAQQRDEPPPAPARRHPRLQRAGRAGTNLRPRLEGGGHPEARRTGSDTRSPRPADDLQHLDAAEGRPVADGPSRHAALRPEPDGERLYRREAPGRLGCARVLPSLPLDCRHGSARGQASEDVAPRRPLFRCPKCCPTG